MTKRQAKSLNLRSNGRIWWLVYVCLILGMVGMLAIVFYTAFIPWLHSLLSRSAKSWGWPIEAMDKQFRNNGALNLRIAAFAALLTLPTIGIFSLCLWRLARRRFQQSLVGLLGQLQDMRKAEDSASSLEPDHMVVTLQQEIDTLIHELDRRRGDIEHMQRLHEHRMTRRTEKFQKDLARLEKKSNSDSMTGLSNRAHLNRQFVEMFEDARKNKNDLACLMIDIDNFKTINDALGHQAGDRVIHFVSDLLKASIRPQDFVARYGGDEFVMILSACNRRQALAVGERLNRIFARESYRFVVPGSNQARRNDSNNLTPPYLSIGIATLHANDPLNAEHLLQLADEALYQAKAAGRNCVRAR